MYVYMYVCIGREKWIYVCMCCEYLYVCTYICIYELYARMEVCTVLYCMYVQYVCCMYVCMYVCTRAAMIARSVSNRLLDRDRHFFLPEVEVDDKCVINSTIASTAFPRTPIIPYNPYTMRMLAIMVYMYCMYYMYVCIYMYSLTLSISIIICCRGRSFAMVGQHRQNLRQGASMCDVCTYVCMFICIHVLCIVVSSDTM